LRNAEGECIVAAEESGGWCGTRPRGRVKKNDSDARRVEKSTGTPKNHGPEKGEPKNRGKKKKANNR